VKLYVVRSVLSHSPFSELQQYQELNALRKDYPDVPIMALTATANKVVVDDIVQRLGLRNHLKLTHSFNRPNLHYDVRPKTRNVVAEIASFIKSNHPGDSGVIYCFSRANCEEVAKDLRERHDLRAKHYHAGLSTQDKSRTQSAWHSGDCDIMVATVRGAFLSYQPYSKHHPPDCFRYGHR
jgi:bloom syndrome protein